jgi:PAS domain S-box-containing protein
MMGAKILLVDDNPVTRKMVRYALEQKGYLVIEASDGESALALLSTQTPDLILQDLILPDIGGFELVGRLREKLGNKRIPILAFSGFVSKLEESRISTVDFDDHIVKPIEPSRLIQIIQSHLPLSITAPLERFGAGRNLVVADDDPLQAKLTMFRLERLGFQVRMAGDGLDALTLARAQVPDAIVTDVMMPRTDGFQLCIEARRDPLLKKLPIILVTSSYMDDADHSLADQVGADAYVLRTPDLKEVTEALRTVLAKPHVRVVPSPRGNLAEIEREHAKRVIIQLERQVSLNAGISQRCATLSAELSILSGISNALARHEDLDLALDEILAANFDAGGIAIGSIYLFGKDGLQVRCFGAGEAWTQERLRDFFGDNDELHKLLALKSALVLLNGDERLPNTNKALQEQQMQSALIMPLIYREQLLGALLLASKTESLREEDRVAFASGVASQISLAVALVQTFSEKLASENSAKKTAATLRAVMESMADAVVVADESGVISYANAAAETSLGMRLAGRAKESVAQFGMFRADKKTPFTTEELPLVRAVRGENTDEVAVFVRPPNDPRGLWLSVNTRPLIDADGLRRGGVAVFRNVTTEKEAQEHLMISDRMASVGMLAAGVAHEINNPLAAVVANLDFSLDNMQNLMNSKGAVPLLANMKEALQDAREGAERVRKIVQDLKVFSRSEEATNTSVDVERVMESSLRMAWNEIRHRAHVVKNYQRVPPILGNEPRLGQVFLNLLVNAAQAIPEGRADSHEIRVVTRFEPPKRVIIEVHDTGPGIPPEVLSQLFTPFFTTKPVGVGTGLGLAICRRIVSGFGGEITVESEVGRGTIFRISLPAAVQRPTSSKSTPSSSLSSRRGKILSVDDDPGVSSVIRRVLSAEHDVTLLSNATDALDRIFEGERFDVILCDLMMPVITGLEFYQTLVQRVPEQAERIVFLTGGAFTAKTKELLDKTPNARLEKPFSIKDLKALINERVR